MQDNHSLLFEAKKEIVRIQVYRFKVYYKSYFELEETQRMVRYFFDKIYNLEGKEEWIYLAKNTFEKVKNMIKEQTKNNVEQLIELNDLTDYLDGLMAELLLNKGWQTNQFLSLDDYNQLYRELGLFEERKKQLLVVLKNMKLFYELAHRPINVVIMKPAKFMSKVLGVYPLFASVEEGYHAVLPVHREIFDKFYEEVQKKEWEFLYSQFPEERLDANR